MADYPSNPDEQNSAELEAFIDSYPGINKQQRDILKREIAYPGIRTRLERIVFLNTGDEESKRDSQLQFEDLLSDIRDMPK